MERIERAIIAHSVRRDTTNFLKEFRERKYTESNIPKVNFPRKKQPESLRAKLSNYQINAYNWMHYVEAHCDEEFKFCTLVPWFSAKTDVLFNFSAVNLEDFFCTVEAVEANSYGLKSRGGILADEMGLGKSLEIIALILSNPMDPSDPTLGTPKPLNPSSSKSYLQSRATLIHCPNHLAKQWKEEILKNTNPPLQVATVTTIREYQSYTYQDLCTYDVVIVSFQFLENRNYLEKYAGRGLPGPKDHHVPLNRIFFYRIVLDEGHEIISGKKKVGRRVKDVPVPIMAIPSNYKWFVSGTPFPSHDVALGILEFLISKNRIVEVLSLGDQDFTLFSILDLVISNLYWRNTKSSINSEEHDIPDAKTELVLIEFHPVEKALYDDALGNQERQLEICCNPYADYSYFHTNGYQQTNHYPIKSNNLEQVRASMTHIRECECQGLEFRYTSLQNERNGIMAKIEATLNPVQKARHHTQLVAHDAWMKRIETQLEEVRARVAIWEKVRPIQKQEMSEPKKEKSELESESKKEKSELESEPKMEKSELESEPKKEKSELAPEPPKKEKSELAPEPSKKEILKKEKQIRRSNRLAGKKVYEIEDIADEPPEEDSMEEPEPLIILTKEELILTRGSKVAHVITYLRELWDHDPEAKIIIFSKFPWMLFLLGEQLEEEGITSVVVEGNVHRRNKAILSFSQKCKVILLGMKSAASGTNLTQATHIILVDPMNGTAKEIKATEAQAIARAHRRGQENEITICRFIVRGTVEHENYLLVYGGREEKPIEEMTTTTEPAVPKVARLVRSNSVTTLLANRPKLSRSASIGELLEVESESESD